MSFDAPATSIPRDRFGIPEELACSGGRSTPVRNLVGGWQAAWLSVLGPRYALLPRRVRGAIRASVIGRRAARRLVASLDSFDGWAGAWIDYADEAKARGDLRGEVAAIGLARLWFGRSEHPLDYELRDRLRSCYLTRDDLGTIETLAIPVSGTVAPALLQLPEGPAPDSGWPVVVVQCGIGESKERSHRLASRSIASGLACLRLDMPDDGATRSPGHSAIVAEAVDAVERDPRLDGGNIHLFGGCFGGAMVLLGAIMRPQVRSVTAISSWYEYVPSDQLMPTSLLEYVVSGLAVERDEHGQVVRLPPELTFQEGALGSIPCPVALYHGALDLVTSAKETWRIAAELDPARTTTTVFALDGHGCTRNRERIETELLERISGMPADVAATPVQLREAA